MLDNCKAFLLLVQNMVRLGLQATDFVIRFPDSNKPREEQREVSQAISSCDD